MQATSIRVGLIGAGGNTRSRHIPGLQALEGVSIVGVCNRSPESSQRVASEFKIPKIYRHWTDVVADPEVDAVVIGTWPYLHAPATIATLEANKHVLCEARMAMNASEAHAMWESSRVRPHLVAQLVPAPFTLPIDRTMKRLLAERFLGEVLAVEVRGGGTFLDENAPITWRQQWEFSGTNIMSLGIWYETIMRWLGHSTRIQALGQTFVRQRPDDTGQMRAVRVPEHIDVVCEMECGAQAHFQVSSLTGHAGGPDIWLFGSEGTLRFFNQKLWGGKREAEELQEIEIPADEAGQWRVEAEFIGAIRGLEPVTHTTFSDGVKYMEWTEAVTRSMAEGRTIALPLTSM